MFIQNTFKRYELKYLLSTEQKEQILNAMQNHMAPDKYGQTVIRNIYFDTPNYRLIRHSIEHPVYKEKLRIRSYSPASADSDIFIELKKKYNHIVYKRRLVMRQDLALQWMDGNATLAPEHQIGREIEYFRKYYGNLQPVLYLSYNRQAWYALDGSNFRVTFDDHIHCCQENISLDKDDIGTLLLDDQKYLMEIKTGSGIPLWMTHLLTQNSIYKTSFSKYGTAYEKLIYPQMRKENIL